MGNKKITLLNGKSLVCLKGHKRLETSQPVKYLEDMSNLEVFKYFANFLLDNANIIRRDSRMFFCPIYTQSFSSFFRGRPVLGTFIEWWLQYPEFSRDKNGNPIYSISGDPTTESHACYSVNKSGYSIIATENKFLDILKSFGRVNSLYQEAKENCEFYQLNEVLKSLCGDKYDLYLELIRTQSRLQNLTGYYKEQEGKYSIIFHKLNRVMYENKKLQLRDHKDEILKFYSEYKPMAEESDRLFEEYVAYKHECNKKYKFGLISEIEYLEATNMAYQKYEANLNLDLYDFGNKFLKETFGSNPNEITIDDIIRFAEGKHISRNITHFNKT